MTTKVIPCGDDAECEKLGSFLADRIYAIEGRPKGYADIIYVKTLRPSPDASRT